MDPSSEDLEQARIGELLEARCQELRLTWNVVAQRSGLSREGLSRLRRGVGTPRRLTKRGVEDTVFWRHGSIDRIVRGGNPEPYGTIARTGDYVTVTFTERDVVRTVRADTGEEVGWKAEEAYDTTVTPIEGKAGARSDLTATAKDVGLPLQPPFPKPKSKSQEAVNRYWEALRAIAEGEGDEEPPAEGTVRALKRAALDLEDFREGAEDAS